MLLRHYFFFKILLKLVFVYSVINLSVPLTAVGRQIKMFTVFAQFGMKRAVLGKSSRHVDVNALFGLFYITRCRLVKTLVKNSFVAVDLQSKICSYGIGALKRVIAVKFFAAGGQR